jgi:hypothetical protein
MTDTQLLSVLVALGILVNLWGRVIVRDIHKLTNETLLSARMTLDSVGELLKERRAQA